MKRKVLIWLRWLGWTCVLGVIGTHASMGWALEVLGPAENDIADYVHGGLKQGTKLTYDGPKGTYWLKLVENDGERLVFDNSRGCRYVYSLVPFADSIRNRCDSKKPWGKRRIDVKGKLPRSLGSGIRFSFETAGRSKSGKAYKNVRDCVVDDAVQIRVKAGVFDTFPVNCEQKGNRYTFYASPDLNTWVAYVFQSGKKPPVTRELVEVALE